MTKAVDSLTKSASKTLSDGRTSKTPKAAAGSALTQHAMSKPATLTANDARRIVKTYLSEKRA